MQMLSTVLLVSFGVLGSASASTTITNSSTDQCNIFNTGSDSRNECETNIQNEVTISCVNDIYVVNGNSESAATGPAIVTGNSASGDATSGSSANNNGAFISIGSTCHPITVASTTTVVPTPKSNPTPMTSTPAAIASKPVVKSLPHTGSNALENYGIVTIVSVAAVALASRLGIFAIRRSSLK